MASRPSPTAPPLPWRARSAGETRQATEGEWSAVRVLAHMVSYARHNDEFINAVAWMTDAVRQSWDEAAEVEAEGWDRLDAAALADLLRAELAPTVDLLGGTPDASWGRAGIVPARGRRRCVSRSRGTCATSRSTSNSSGRALAPRPPPTS